MEEANLNKLIIVAKKSIYKNSISSVEYHCNTEFNLTIRLVSEADLII